MYKITRKRNVWVVTLLSLALFTACSKDDDSSTNTGGTVDITNNINSNLKDLRSATHRLEFPKLKGGHSTVLTHKLRTGEVNYSVEWDIEKMSNRWTCYQIYASNAQQNAERKSQKVLTSTLWTLYGPLMLSSQTTPIMDLAMTMDTFVPHKTG